METLTHWKKNIDQAFISGEDLQNELKGLRKEMVVTVDHFGDAETFDTSKAAKATVTGLYLKEHPSGVKLFKPVVLNKTNAKFFQSETKSPFMEKWVGIPVIVYAMPDKRFGFVVRFKKYYPPAQVSDARALDILSKATDIDKLGMAWGTLSTDEQKLPTVLAKKEALKSQFKTAE